MLTDDKDNLYLSKRIYPSLGEQCAAILQTQRFILELGQQYKIE